MISSNSRNAFLVVSLNDWIDFCLALISLPVTDNWRLDSDSLTRKSLADFNNPLPSVSDASVATSRRDATEDFDNETNNPASEYNAWTWSGVVNKMAVKFSQKKVK